MKKFISIASMIALLIIMVALAGCSNTNSQNNVVEPAEKAFVGKTLNLFVAAGLQNARGTDH